MGTIRRLGGRSITEAHGCDEIDCQRQLRRRSRLGNLRIKLPKAARRVNRDLGKVEKDCRKAAPKEEQIGKFANQTNGRERVK
jgi:hypothetical protein